MQASIVEKTQCLLPFCASFTCLSPEKRVGLDVPNPCDIAKQPFVNLSLLCLNQLNHYDLFFSTGDSWSSDTNGRAEAQKCFFVHLLQ